MVLSKIQFLSWNSRKTERGAKQFLTSSVVRAAPFALPSDFESYRDEAPDRGSLEGGTSPLIRR